VTEFGGNVPLVPVMLRVYVPGETVFGTVTFSTAVPSLPVDIGISVGGTIAQMGPAGEHDTLTATVPENVLRLVTTTSWNRFGGSPFDTCIVLVLGTRSKYPVTILVNLAVCAFSWSGIAVPLWMVTQIPPETLVLLQPVWKMIGDFAEFPTTR